MYGVLIGGYGTGAVVGGLVMVWFGDSLPRSVFAVGGLFAMVVGVLFLGLAPAWALAFAGLFLIGIAQVFTMVACNTTIQVNVDEGFRGRASSVFTMSFFAAAPIGALLGGLIGEVAGLRPTIVVEALLLVGFTCWAMVRYQRLRPLDITPVIADHTLPET